MAVSILPGSTQKLVESARARHPVHPGLELTKFVPWTDERRDGKRVKPITPEPARKNAFDHVIAALSRTRDLTSGWRDRRAEWLRKWGDRALRFEVETVSPCVLWLAAPTALELGFCLHHTYGVPYLPGSGLKGLARRQCLLAHDGTDEKPDAETRRLFGEGGDGGHVGLVDFLDGIPLDPACLELDVMSPHHSRYYSGREKIPHDCEDPVPIPFLRIKVGSRFEIALMTGPEGTGGDLEKVKQYLLDGLDQLGLGAKTSSGYGILRVASEKGQATGPATARPSQPVQQGGRQVVTAYVVRLEQGHVFLADEQGTEYSVSLEELYKRWLLKEGKVKQYHKSQQRIRMVFKNGRLDEFGEDR